MAPTGILHGLSLAGAACGTALLLAVPTSSAIADVVTAQVQPSPATESAIQLVSAPTEEPTAVDSTRQAFEVARAAAAAAAAAEKAWHLPVGTYNISSYFGEQRADGPHLAIDLAGPSGQPVLAARSGVVVESGWQDGYGFVVTLEHSDGFRTRYAHLMDQPPVPVGAAVAGGQVIGLLGNTGYSTGAHLHLELFANGALIDPSGLIPIPPSAGS